MNFRVKNLSRKKPEIANCSVMEEIRWWWPNGIEDDWNGDDGENSKSLYNATVRYHYMDAIQSETKFGLSTLSFRST